MLKLAAVVAAAAAIAAIVPLATIHQGKVSVSRAEARGIDAYHICIFDAQLSCYPRDGSGQPRPPNLGDPDESAAYEMCVAATIPRCAGLPGDPNN